MFCFLSETHPFGCKRAPKQTLKDLGESLGESSGPPHSPPLTPTHPPTAPIRPWTLWRSVLCLFGCVSKVLKKGNVLFRRASPSAAAWTQRTPSLPDPEDVVPSGPGGRCPFPVPLMSAVNVSEHFRWFRWSRTASVLNSSMPFSLFGNALVLLGGFTGVGGEVYMNEDLMEICKTS